MENILFKAMLSKVQKDILENREELEKIYEIDAKHCQIEFEVRKLIEIIEYYKNIDIPKKEEKMLFFCNGNPYIVLNLSLITICQKTSSEIDIDDTMLGINTLILKIIGKVIADNGLNGTIKIVKKSTAKKAVFIDRVSDYHILKKNYEKAKLIPYQSIDVYKESEKYSDLFETIYDYAISQNIDINLFQEEGIETMLQYGKGKKILLLTDKKYNIETQEYRQIFINENPFVNEDIIFEKDIINFIIF